MTTQNNSSAHPDLIFGPSDGNEGFMVLHKRNELSPEQIKSFDGNCRRLSWAATKEPPEKLHALVLLGSNGTLLLLHVRQQLDDKNRRALRVEGYLYPKASHGDLLKKAQSLALIHNLYIKAAAEDMVLTERSLTALSKTNLLQIENLPHPSPPSQKKHHIPNPPIRENANTTSPDTNNKPVMKILAVAFGLVLGSLATYLIVALPQKNEIANFQSELESLGDQVATLSSENNDLDAQNAELRRNLDSANKRIGDLQADNTNLRSEFSPEELKIRELLTTDQQRKELAKRLREDATEQQKIADKLHEIADQLQSDSNWEASPKK